MNEHDYVCFFFIFFQVNHFQPHSVRWFPFIVLLDESRNLQLTFNLPFSSILEWDIEICVSYTFLDNCRKTIENAIASKQSSCIALCDSRVRSSNVQNPCNSFGYFSGVLFCESVCCLCTAHVFGRCIDSQQTYYIQQ